MDESSNTQNRRSGRSPVLLSAEIEIEGAAVAVILRNLSSEGALIEGATLPSEGAATIFRRKGLTVEGRIVWVEGRFAGLAFDRQLDREEMHREIPKPRRRVEPSYRRPGLASEPLTDGERHMIQLWLTPSAFRGD
ncbi:MAG: hypothetical protein QOF05_959, partial [Sphingomonadales bacterium]|nr:hypothetical protein [Sphingomonadales bacterium]